MSLINDLLCDLEARKATAIADSGYADLRPVQSNRAIDLRWLVAPLVGLLLAGSAGAFWYNESPSTLQMPAVAGSAASTVTTPATRVVAHAPAATLLGLSNTLSRLPSAKRKTAAPTVPAVAAAVTTPGIAAKPVPVTAAVAVEPQAAPVQPAALEKTDHRAEGLLALSHGRNADAESHFRKFLASDSADTDSWLSLASALRQQGKTAEAEASLSTALATAAKPATLARALARDLLGRGAEAEALQILQAYRPATPLDPTHDAFVAAVLQRVGQHDEAADMYRSVLAVRPEAATWWVGLAISEEALGLEGSAVKAYRHARNIGNLDAALARYAEQRIAAIEQFASQSGEIT